VTVLADPQVTVDRYRTLQRMLGSLIRQSAPVREIADVLLEVHELELRLLVHGQSLARIRFEEEEGS
jgi:hypothetical protein